MAPFGKKNKKKSKAERLDDRAYSVSLGKKKVEISASYVGDRMGKSACLLTSKLFLFQFLQFFYFFNFVLFYCHFPISVTFQAQNDDEIQFT